MASCVKFSYTALKTEHALYAATKAGRPPWSTWLLQLEIIWHALGDDLIVVQDEEVGDSILIGAQNEIKPLIRHKVGAFCSHPLVDCCLTSKLTLAIKVALQRILDQKNLSLVIFGR